MRLAWFAAALLLLCATRARADALTDLTTALGALAGHEPVAARVDFDFTQTRGDEGEKAEAETAKLNLEVVADDTGLRMTWSPEIVAAARQEAADTSDDPKRPTTRALSEVAVPDIDLCLHAAPRLLSLLHEAKLVGVSDTTWDDKPARLMTLTLTPRIASRDRKYVKHIDARMKLWLDADGLPLAATVDSSVKGRAMLVISFESNAHERFRFEHRGDRLLAIEHEQSDRSSGAGEVGGRRLLTRLSLH